MNELNEPCFLSDWSPDHDPPDWYYAVEPQVWARLDADGCVTAGITALGVKLSGEIFMCRPKGVGVVVEQFRSMGVVELAKSIVSVKAPISGRVIEVNPALAKTPEIVHLKPYTEGWLVRLQPSDLQADLSRLLTGPAVAEAMKEHARLFRVNAAPGVAPGPDPTSIHEF